MASDYLEGIVWVKVCCISSVDEVRQVVAAGATHVGFVDDSALGGLGAIGIDAIASLAPHVPDGIVSVLLTGQSAPELIAAQAKRTGIACIQLVRGVTDYNRLRALLPAATLIQVVHVTSADPSGVDAPADAILLDSADLATGALGATGRTHDWDVSREIVARSRRPVWLAGGLNAGNVGAAIRAVNPHGVDLCSGVRRDGVLDDRLLADFFAAVSA